MTTQLVVETHPLLALRAFTTQLPRPVGQLATPSAVTALLRLDSPAPLSTNDALRAAIRDVLRTGGFKPTGRSKPAAEYLQKAAREGSLSSINFPVDCCNAVSLHSGLPISVVDLDRLTPPLRIAPAAEGASYVFNASGQVMDVAGLVCLHDQQGPCANAVKDSQRAKTTDMTTNTLSIIWGATLLQQQLDGAERWYRQLLAEHDAVTDEALLTII